MTPRNHPGKFSGKRLLVQAVFCWLVILGVCSGTLASEPKPAKRILMLFSYQSVAHSLLEWDEGIRSVLQGTALEPMEFYTEYLDLARFPDKVYLQNLVNFLQTKYRGKKFDLLIPVGPLAFNFMLDHSNTIFPGAPTVFCAALKDAVLASKRPKNFTGVAAWVDVAGTLDAALKIQPKAGRLAIVGGTSESDRAFQRIAQRAVSKYEGKLEITWLTDLPADTILERLAKLPPHTIVLYLYLFRDSLGNEFLPQEFLGRVAQAASAPIYGLWENLMGHGIVGGHLMSFRAQGQKAGELGRRVLRGEKPENIPIAYEGNNFYLFDWRQLKRWGLPETALPPGSEVRFRAISVWEHYKWYITGLCSLILLQGLVISVLIINRRKRLCAEGNLAARLQFETLMAELSAKFINLPTHQVDLEIEQSLQRLADFLGIDRVRVWQLSPDHKTFLPTHSWATAGLERSPQVTLNQEFPWLLKKLLQGQPIALSSPAELPQEAAIDRQSFNNQGIKSALTVPLKVAGALIGTMTLGTLRFHRQWPTDAVAGLQLVGEIFANALARQQAEMELQEALKHIEQLRDQLQADYSYLQEEIKLEYDFDQIIGQSNELKYVLFKVQQVAPTDTTVLILGETGTGKELIARAIHHASSHRHRPLIKVDCAALSPSLIESELFGHEKGAFTGAVARKIGRFELANGSTIFLDEIGELPLDLQSKLLRVLQSGEFERLGSSKTLKVEVRVIAATNRKLEEEERQGHFREDLWYRLNVFPITVPPLRQRREDIPLLVRAFVARFAKRIGKEITKIPAATMESLCQYDWPGNIRELENIVERAVVNSSGSVLTLADPLNTSQASSIPGLERKTLEEVEREHILQVLQETGGRVSGSKGAAAILGLNPNTLRARLRKLGIALPK
jgi:formate hydrogenlyase transcriptional activator